MTGNVSHDGLSIREKGNTRWKWRHHQRTQTVELGKSRLDSSCGQDGAMLHTNNNHHHCLTPTWPGPPTPVSIRTDDMSHAVSYNLPRNEQHIWDYSRTRWGWPGLVVMFTVQAMTLLSAVRAKAKHLSAICPSRMEHSSGTETSASSDNHTDRYCSNARESPTIWQLCAILKTKRGLKTQLIMSNLNLNVHVEFTRQ